MRLTREAFLADPQGVKFKDVVGDGRIPFDELLEFFSDPPRQVRMQDSERYHDRPALAGVVRELEEHYEHVFGEDSGRTTYRYRQAVGVIVRMVMEGLGWTKTGVKGSLANRARWFTKAERYLPGPGRKEA